ncbi:hypothetical protein F441_00911 [Phytophthora nicotianae CJ01A1]|uniref:WW domain-containing protein n=4 Tax=Phytophthora nicotianae TaxID=4792 RepID=V9FYL9_PHYNI|nr:hypothetical protein F443_00933 [Phytophthora nicotianae P1569]ETK96359.1 hypothetical protein L915_00877 [Phytophthora nicotianae]ETO85297.1 hypothetical protein F444_00945 [Phytophthora nicotianae P1976]ETP26367.1 hypothetical protein F441_00911 [Phytophthora nicotianae CJ01A1]ETL49725.1 hypothetical protein L916_00866 [Phytophthora nicotianae]
MENHDVKLLLLHYALLALHYLKLALQHAVRLVQTWIVFIQHYSDVVAKSPVLLKLKVWMERAAKRPWFLRFRNAVYRCAAFVVGSTYIDEHVAFTARELVKNDAYRDRLLVREIEDLVDLCDALRLTLPQRKAYFQCFLHVDFMRRSSVSRAELLRYCDLRPTPLTTFLLPNAKEATHRETARNRWDIMQLMAMCFSVCTADCAELVRRAVSEAIYPQKAEADESGREELMQEDTGTVRDQVVDDKLPSTPSICHQIDKCLEFFIGVPDPVERNLLALLKALYDNECEQQHGLESPRISFQDIHTVTTIFDVVRLFPVLIFPCIWTQRVLQTRILGAKTWENLQQRRMQIQPHLPTGIITLSVADIVAASQVQLQQKLNRDYQILTPTSEQPDTDSAQLGGGSSCRSDDYTGSKKSTPRKVVPSTRSEPAKLVTEAPYKFDEPRNFSIVVDQCSSVKEAWRVSANHALASVYVLGLLEDSTTTLEVVQAEFEQVTKTIFTGELSTEKSERIRQRLVKVYGYRFAHSLLAKSNLKELSHASKTPPDERRAKQRYDKAWGGSGLVEDKVIYWKEYEDPLAKRVFYYNARTGESRWEKPANFVSKKKVRRRKKVGNNEVLQPKPSLL